MWDEQKEEWNLKKHGIGFEDATEVFGDTQRIEWYDERGFYGEDRYVTIGATRGGDLLTVVYTERKRKLRLISARRANSREIRFYDES